MKTVSKQSNTKVIESLIDQMIDKVREAFNSYSTSADIGKVRICINSEEIDPLGWLSVQKTYPAIYWSDRLNKFETAGIGCALSLNSLDAINFSNSDKNIRLFGGFRFDNTIKRESPWNKMDRALLVLPRFEVSNSDSGTEFVCNLMFPDDLNKFEEISKQIKNIKFDEPKSKDVLPKLMNRFDNPGNKIWNENILKILELIEDNKIEKLVSARESTLEFSDSIDPVKILAKLKESASGCFHYCFQLSENYAFIGASPERLYYRNKDKIISEALAGTRVRGNNPEEDNNLGRELLNSEKDILEHQYVSRSILKNFEKFCKSVKSSDELSLMKLARIQHMMTGINGELKEGITDRDILSSLHPTPAVGGFPRENAADLISEIEPFDRGWYSGPVGWIKKDEAEFAVAIRSGLIEKNKLHLYAGAGIVKGSDPDNEWNEIESKIATFMRILS